MSRRCCGGLHLALAGAMLGATCSGIRAGPVLEVGVSQDYLGRLTRKVDEPSTAHFTSRGFDVTNRVRLVGQLRLSLVPCADRGVIRTTLTGTSTGVGQATRHALTLEFQVQSAVAAFQDVHLHGSQLVYGGQSTHSPTCTQLTGVCTTLPPVRDCLLRTAARVGTSTPANQEYRERVANEAAEFFLAQEQRRQLEEALPQLNQQLRQRLLVPLERFDIGPADLRAHSTLSSLHIRALGTDSTPCPPASNAQLRICFHQSLLNRQLSKELAGQRLTQARMKELQGRYPFLSLSTPRPAKGTKKADRDDDRELTLLLADREPVTVETIAGKVTIKLQVAEFRLEEETYPGTTISIHYLVIPTLCGPRLERMPTLDIASGEAKSGKPASMRVRGFRSVLRRRLERSLPSEVVLARVAPAQIDPIEQGASQRFQGPTLYLSDFLARDGWLVLEYNMAPGL